MSDNKCAKCGAYSGGATLCRKCEKAAVKKTPKTKKPAPKKGAAPAFTASDLLRIETALRLRAEASEECGDHHTGREWRRVLEKAQAMIEECGK